MSSDWMDRLEVVQLEANIDGLYNSMGCWNRPLMLELLKSTLLAAICLIDCLIGSRLIYVGRWMLDDRRTLTFKDDVGVRLIGWMKSIGLDVGGGRWRSRSFA